MTLTELTIAQKMLCNTCKAEIPRGQVNVFKGKFYCKTCVKYLKNLIPREKIGKYSGKSERPRGAYELY